MLEVTKDHSLPFTYVIIKMGDLESPPCFSKEAAIAILQESFAEGLCDEVGFFKLCTEIQNLKLPKATTKLDDLILGYAENANNLYDRVQELEQMLLAPEGMTYLVLQMDASKLIKLSAYFGAAVPTQELVVNAKNVYCDRHKLN